VVFPGSRTFDLSAAESGYICFYQNFKGNGKCETFGNFKVGGQKVE
jgi:hypothetical protein